MVEASFAGTPSAPGDARRFVAHALRGWELEPLIDTVTLLVSEAVTNSVSHAESDVAIRVDRVPGNGVRVEVQDREVRGAQEALLSAPLAEHGRGLFLIESLAADWGWQPLPSGKYVWFVVSEDATT